MEHTVIIDGVRYVAVDGCPGEEEPLKVGDFVHLAGDTALEQREGYLNSQMYGKVISMDYGQVGVEFARYNENFHSDDGHTQEGHGYNFLASELVKEQ